MVTNRTMGRHSLLNASMGIDWHTISNKSLGEHSLNVNTKKMMGATPRKGGFQSEDYWIVGSNMATTFIDVSDELANVKEQVSDLSIGIKFLKSELLSCAESINAIKTEISERPIIKGTWLYDISEDLDLLQAIPVVIEETEDEVIVSYPEIEVYATGTGEAEAINNLKIEISKLYYELIETPDEILGKVPRTWKRILSKVMRRIGKTERV